MNDQTLSAPVLNQLKAQTVLNGICAYFTMFPLDFPYSILQEQACPGDNVLDPFCGRGTTNFASRLLGLPSVGIDSHPLAIAVSRAKLVQTTPGLIVTAARRILEEISTPPDLPQDEFWKWAYHPEILAQLCRLRAGLLKNCDSDTRKALLAILLGALHGQLRKTIPAYFSNQMPRTYSPKPGYSVKYWRQHNLLPPKVDLLQIIQTRAERFYSKNTNPAPTPGRIIRGDSRQPKTFFTLNQRFKWVITSPPYYGMRTYIPDQWLRLWFLGGPASVDYTNANQLNHISPESFASELKQVWENAASVAAPSARLIIRFGGINDRKANHLDIIKTSLLNSGWEIEKIVSAGSASSGRRQAEHFATTRHEPIQEHDIWATYINRFGKDAILKLY